MSNTVDVLQEAMKRQHEYYEKNSKNMIFKNSQKNDCANYVSTNTNLQRMIQCTAVIIPNTNIIYYNYLLFKTYANDDNTQPLMVHITNLVNILIERYSNFEFHVNLKSFSVSACQRYYPYIHSIFDTQKSFIQNISKFVIYHTPNVIQQMTRMLHPCIRDYTSIIEYVYEDSDNRIQTLFA